MQDGLKDSRNVLACAIWLSLATAVWAQPQPWSPVQLEPGHRHGRFVSLVEPDTAVDSQGPVLWAHLTYQYFIDAFAGDDWGLKKPSRDLEIVVLSDSDRMLRYARQVDGLSQMPWVGYYSVATHRVVMRDLDGATVSAQRAVAAGMDASAIHGTMYGVMHTDQIALGSDLPTYTGLTLPRGTHRNYVPKVTHDNRYAFMTHEAAHQLAFDLGIQRRGVAYPLWVSEGLACAFEWQGTSAGFGPGQNNPQRLHDLLSLVENGKLMPLEDLVVLTRMNSDALPGADAFYAQAWGLFTYLYQHHRSGLQGYLRALRESGIVAVNPVEARELFAKSFGSIVGMESAWHGYLDSFTSPLPAERAMTLVQDVSAKK